MTHDDSVQIEAASPARGRRAPADAATRTRLRDERAGDCEKGYIGATNLALWCRSGRDATTNFVLQAEISRVLNPEFARG